MKYVFVLLVLIHALIHLMGFAKAFQYAAFDSITGTISKPVGSKELAVAMQSFIATYSKVSFAKLLRA